jgi:hypothetical protein
MFATVLACARRRGLVFREVPPADLPAIERVARSSFPAPRGWAERPENLARYRPGYPRITRVFIILTCVPYNDEWVHKGYACGAIVSYDDYRTG